MLTCINETKLHTVYWILTPIPGICTLYIYVLFLDIVLAFNNISEVFSLIPNQLCMSYYKEVHLILALFAKIGIAYTYVLTI